MLFTPRVYQLASAPDRNLEEIVTSSPYLRLSPGWRTLRFQRKHARKMLLVHQTGNLKVGEVVRYTVTYEPSSDRILPSPQHLFVRIKNNAALPLRAAYLHGPYTLHVAAYPAHFNPNEKLTDVKKHGAPQFEPNLKAGGVWNAKIPVPEEIRVTGNSGGEAEGDGPKKLTWIIEITSQIIFSSSASVSFELLISRDERSLDFGLTAVGGHEQRQSFDGSDQVHDRQQGSHRHGGNKPAHTKGVYSKAIKLKVDDTESLWNTPPLPGWEAEQEKGKKAVEHPDDKSKDKSEERPRKKQKIHLVILTHGLHSNLSADMLYMKESIDAAAKQAQESKRKRREASKATPGTSSTAAANAETKPVEDSEDEDEDEQIMVRGFTGNAVKTENGIQYLGKRMAKYILDFTFPDQPYRPIRRSMSEKFSNAISSNKKAQTTDEQGRPTHSGSTIRMEDVSNADLAYTFSKISFIGHSLGGLVQLYAIGYIQKHAPQFFDYIKPVNFVALASPFLGLSNENPMYVKFALDFGLVGRTGQDLGLTWRPPSLAKQGWNAIGFGSASKDPDQPDPGAKPLLRILPTGPAHRVLRMFRNRTVYSNVVNDGIVPLRTSCLLFLDWKGLSRVEKARRENGIIGTVANWGWSELTGASSSSNALITEDEGDENAGEDAQLKRFETTVPQPAEDETNQDYQEQGGRGSAEHHYLQQESQPKSPPMSPRPLDGLRNFLGLTLKTSKKDLKMYKRTQTFNAEDSEARNGQSEQPERSPGRTDRPVATRGDSMTDDQNSNAPPKTSIFESAGDILNPPIPPLSWIIDPSSRARTIFHDRIYHPEDIPPPTIKRRKTSERLGLSSQSGSAHAGTAEASTADLSGMKVEEKIARAYHKDLSWRKVLVRLEPDAHNNMIVRRMFANAYGWPVVQHLCDTHFADTYTARTRDELEPATDRAKGVEKPVGEHGEHVKGQQDTAAPDHQASDMRESADELMPLRAESGGSVNIARSMTDTSTTRGSSYDSYDDRYYQDNNTDDEENRGIIPRFWSPPPIFSGGKASPTSSKRASESKDEEHCGTSQAEIADFLTAEPLLLEGHRGLEPTPLMPGQSTGDVGLKGLEAVRPESKGGKESVSENVAKSIGSSQSPAK
ncbi:uncharacterized protein PV09_01087 [Verruconis gallopava]|uniref:DUF676 domain-containing protein n=1 Tax=Verruconis gallopava TaxID=253628 RepID=A0A0D2BA42_9PEZI|nr:uncharacterized protein PV09_01087 [Verruconis gallopava]KIW08154.1 hypothetical protein PV09_01087 [Verruconis gallopava]